MTEPTFDRINPVTGGVATTAPAMTVADAEAAVAAAAAAFPASSVFGPNACRAPLTEAADALEAKVDASIDAMMGENRVGQETTNGFDREDRKEGARQLIDEKSCKAGRRTSDTSWQKG